MEKTPDLIPDRQISSIARFIPKEWLEIPSLNACSKELWTKTGRNLIFEIKSFKTQASGYSDRILLSLILGPSKPDIREHFFSSARENPAVFKKSGNAINDNWTTIYSVDLLTKAAALSMSDELKEATLMKSWNIFLNNDLPDLIREILKIASSSPA